MGMMIELEENKYDNIAKNERWKDRESKDRQKYSEEKEIERYMWIILHLWEYQYYFR